MKTKLKNFFKLFIFSVIIIFSNAIPTKAMAPPPPPPLPTPVNAPTTPAKTPHPKSNSDSCPCCGLGFTAPTPGKCSACAENCFCKCKSCDGCVKYSTNGKCSECINCPCDCEDKKDKSNNCKKCAKNAEICNPCLNNKCFCKKCRKHKCPCRDIDHSPCALCGSRCSECLTDCVCKRCLCKGCNKTIPDNQTICSKCSSQIHSKCGKCRTCCRCCFCCDDKEAGGKYFLCEKCYQDCRCSICGKCTFNCPCDWCSCCIDARVPPGHDECPTCRIKCNDCGRCKKHRNHDECNKKAPHEPKPDPDDGGDSAGSSVRITLYDYDKKYLSSKAEENPGLFMRLNCDDDNGNDIIDKNEDNEVDSEDDLVWVYLAVSTDRSSGDVIIERKNKNIKLYKPSFDDDDKVDDSKAIVILGDNNSKRYSINKFQKGNGNSFGINRRSFNGNGAIEGWCLMEGYEPGVTLLKIRFDGEEDKGKITVEGAEVAVDGDRDGEIKFSKESDKEMTFWVNNDYDFEKKGKEEDAEVGNGNCYDNIISCKRDLEDFARIHFKFGVIDGSVKYYVKLTGGLKINLFENFDKDGGFTYRTVESDADEQIKKNKIITIDSIEREIPHKYINNVNKKGETCYLFEGVKSGEGELILTAKKDDVIQSEYKIKLKMFDPANLYDYYIVHCINSDDDIIKTTSEKVYTAGFPNQNNDYLLFVHGWNMDGEWEKQRWVETIYKRLYWLGYKGKVGLFSWPTLFDFDWWQPWDVRHYDTSEYRAWRSAEALKSTLNNINGNVCLISHSMGNVVASEALHLSNGKLVDTFISTQAAIPAHCFDDTLRTDWWGYNTPNIYSYYPLNNNYYMFNKENSADKRVRIYNEKDYALKKWRISNRLKPDCAYGYEDNNGVNDDYIQNVDRFYYGYLIPFVDRTLFFPDDRYEIFSFCAESRTYTLGAESESVSWFQKEINLENKLYNFDDKHYSHSRQFLSNIQKEWSYWKQIPKEAKFDLIKIEDNPK